MLDMAGGICEESPSLPSLHSSPPYALLLPRLDGIRSYFCSIGEESMLSELGQTSDRYVHVTMQECDAGSRRPSKDETYKKGGEIVFFPLLPTSTSLFPLFNSLLSTSNISHNVLLFSFNPLCRTPHPFDLKHSYQAC